jgi:heme/copper-type cytochrome/quinol oxidase subunit 1
MKDERQPVAAMTVIVASFLLLVALAVLALVTLLDPIP